MRYVGSSAVSKYRAPRRESRPRRTVEIFGAIIEWPMTLAVGLLGVAIACWERWPRWLAIPVIGICVLTALYLLVFFFMWLMFSDPVTGEF